MDLSPTTLIQAGGAVAFAGAVLWEVRKQTVTLQRLAEAIIRLGERQTVIMDRQKTMRDDLTAAGYQMRELPRPATNDPVIVPAGFTREG